MNLALLTALAWTLGAVAVFAFTTLWLKGKPRAFCRNVTWIAFGPALLGSSYTLYYLHILPEPAWFYQWRSLPFSEVLVLAPALAGAALASLLPRWCRVVIVSGVVFPAFLPFAKPAWAPLDSAGLENTWADGVARQSTRSTCGPASAATVLSVLGIKAGEAELAGDASSSGTGTEAWYLARAIRRKGAEVKFLTNVPTPSEVPLPCIAGVRLLGGTGHFIAIMAREGTRYHVGDPLRSGEWVEEKDLLRRYQFTGFCMAVSRP